MQRRPDGMHRTGMAAQATADARKQMQDIRMCGCVLDQDLASAAASRGFPAASASAAHTAPVPARRVLAFHPSWHHYVVEVAAP